MTPLIDNTLGGITRETFDSLDERQQLGVIFDLLVSRQGDVDALKRRRKVDSSIAGVMGLIGGFVAELLSKIK